MNRITCILGLLSFFILACATTQPHVASKENFHKDKLSQKAVGALQYYFNAEKNLVLRRVHMTSRTIEEGVVYKEISDSTFTLKPGTEGLLKYIYRDARDVDNFYLSFSSKFRPIPFNANNKFKEFRLYIEGSVKTTSGGKLPAVFLRDSEGVLKEVWAVISFDQGNRLTYQVGKKKKTTNIVAEGESMKKKKE